MYSLAWFDTFALSISADALEAELAAIERIAPPCEYSTVLDIGYASRADDEATIQSVARVLRPGGVLLLDLFHPDWLAANGRAGHRDERGATIDRHVRDGRCINRIKYASGGVDHIEFNVYPPPEMTRVAAAAGFEVATPVAWWRPELPASNRHARFQLICRKRSAPVGAV